MLSPQEGSVGKIFRRRTLRVRFKKLRHATKCRVLVVIDSFVEIGDRQSGEAINSWIVVQSKGRMTLEKEMDTSVESTCTPRDPDYWRGGDIPVRLVVSRPHHEEAWRVTDLTQR